MVGEGGVGERDLLEREAGGLSAAHLGHGHALAVDALDGDGREAAQRVGAQQQRVVEADGARQRRARHHGAHALPHTFPLSPLLTHAQQRLLQKYKFIPNIFNFNRNT